TTQPGVTRLVGMLDEAGLVRRERAPEDSRVTIVAITDAGAAAMDAWRTQLGEALLPLFDDLDDEQWRALEQASHILMSRTAVTAGTTR
ncbi:MAG: hypothetical protein K0Q58_460, partial [Microbacterium sp.]|nr:hypothetical protein [Microbacterium sp.]